VVKSSSQKSIAMDTLSCTSPRGAARRCVCVSQLTAWSVPLPWRAKRDAWERAAARAGGVAAEHGAGWATPLKTAQHEPSARCARLRQRREQRRRPRRSPGARPHDAGAGDAAAARGPFRPFPGVVLNGTPIRSRLVRLTHAQWEHSVRRAGGVGLRTARRRTRWAAPTPAPAYGHRRTRTR
jgi:hypothetical protein